MEKFPMRFKIQNLRFSLKLLLIVTACFCLWLGYRANKTANQKKVIDFLRTVEGASWQFDHQLDIDRRYKFESCYDDSIEDLGSGRQFIANLVGDEFYGNLTTIDIHNLDLDDEKLQGLELLSEVDTLRFLSLNGALSKDKTLCLPYLKNLSSLEDLVIGIHRLDDRALKNISGCTNLINLGLVSSVEVTKDGLKPLQKLKRLEYLLLKLTQETEGCLRPLRLVSNLKTLELFGKGITDESLLELSEMSNLEVLDIRSNKITDQGILHLSKMQNLRKLDFNGDKISKECIELLKKKLPNCKVNSLYEIQ